MNKKNKCILFLVLFIFSTALYPQIDNKKKSLKEVLIFLEYNYNYQFTYADDVIKDISIHNPSTNLTFNEIINYLRKETGLIFQFLDNNIITISNNRPINFICGYIIDNELGTPIEGATIIGKNNHTISDSFGYFKLSITGNDESLNLRHLGYKPISLLASYFDQENCSNIYLSSQIEVLSEVLLTNYLTKGIDKVVGGTFNINFSNFGILPGLIETDVLQTVQALPGIQSINETVSNINIRGGTHDQNLLLWDGIKMYQSGHFFGLISVFNPLITTDVSVIKNGTDVNFTDGVSGTIAMKTDSRINNKFSASVGANFINIDGFIDVPIGNKSSLQISARKAISDVIETPTYKTYFDRILQDTEIESNTGAVINSDIVFDFYDTSIRWNYKITDKDELRINFININNELVFNENALINQIEESKESSLIQNSIAGSIFYKKEWNDKIISTFQIYETDYKLKATNANILLQQQLLQENIVSETSIKLNTWYKLNDQLTFLNGYQFIETGITNSTEVDNPIYFDKIREVVREHALYSQVNYMSKTKKTNIKAGLRYNYVDFIEFKDHIIEPRLNLYQKIFDNFSLEILGEFKHQNTSQIINFQTDFLGIEKRRWQLSNNSDIPIITSKQLSSGFNFNNKRLLISIDGYYKEVEGITSQSQGFLNQYINEKVSGTYKVKGIDFLINKKFRKFSTWMSYTFADNEYTFYDFKEVNFPNNLDITHSVTLGASYSSNKFKISAGFNWHSGIPTTKPLIGNEIVDGDINYEEANSSRIKEYFRLDASAIYKFRLSNKINAHAGISIWNGLDHDNIINNYFKIDNNFPVEISNNALSITPNVTFRVNF